MDRLGVTVVTLPFTYEPPAGYYEAWRNQFYVFDVITHLSATLADEEVGVLLDSDCFWLHPADALVAATRRHGLLTYDIGLPPGWPQNGLTREDMQALYAELLAAPVPLLPPYLGGEFFAGSGRWARRLAAEFPALWATLLERHRRGLPHFNEEAHALSFLYYKLGITAGTANPYVKRLYTALLRRNNAAPADYGLTLWHLPTEKRFGIRRLFEKAVDPDSAFWHTPLGPPFAAYLGRHLGVPRRTLRKLVLDVRDAAAQKGSPGRVVRALGHAARHNLTHALRGLRRRPRS